MKYIKEACFFIIGFLLFYSINLFSQDQKIANQLKAVYLKDTISSEAKLDLLTDLAFHTIDSLDESLAYANELISLAEKTNNKEYLNHAYTQKGHTYRMAGNFEEALKSFYRACSYANKLSNKKFLGGGYLAIADTYSEIGNRDNSKIYYNKSIILLSEANDSITLGIALLNFGDEYYNDNDYVNALSQFEQSGEIFKKIDYKMGLAYNLGNIGMVYAKQGKDQIALKNIIKAINILEEADNFEAISEYLISMSDIYAKQDKIGKALEYDHKSLQLAKRYGLKKQISESSLSLSELYKELGNWKASYFHFNEGIAYRDSIRNLEVIEDLADMRTNYEVTQEQDKTIISEQKRKNQRIILWSTIGVLFLIGLLAFGLFKRNKFVRATNKIITSERERSDKLLLNILPAETAQELKDNGSVVAKKYPSVTVLFSDFVGFTSYAENLSPEDLVKTIDYYFSKFDLIMEKYGLEKIKTIGDAYMAAGGLTDKTLDHAKQMVLAAKEMNDFVANAKDDSSTSATFDIRIGINTGPVVAGVVGTKKFAYDIWGDAVNIASRMESNSEPGRINISESTYEIVKNDFACDYRGELSVKNRGVLKMYFITNV